jgi:undecaprenyl-diphosphatase
LLWLFGARRRNAALHWLIAIGGGSLLHLLLSWSLRATPQVLEMTDSTIRGPSAAMSLTTVVLTFFAVMEAAELPRKHRQWPYLAAALILTILALARLYLGMEWLSGALTGITIGMAWTAIVGLAYRQRAVRHFSGAVASLIFYGAFMALFAWQVNEHTADDLAALQSTIVTQEIASTDWWGSGWQTLPTQRTRFGSSDSRSFNAQVAVVPARVANLLARNGWDRVPESDWRWILQALNPDPDQASLPLLGRAYEGRSEELLLRKNVQPDGRLLTIRLWDSGYRLMPEGRVLYFGQISEEHLVQRFRFFSYWSAQPIGEGPLVPIRKALAELEQKQVDHGLLLIRERAANE